MLAASTQTITVAASTTAPNRVSVELGDRTALTPLARRDRHPWDRRRAGPCARHRPREHGAPGAHLGARRRCLPHRARRDRRLRPRPRCLRAGHGPAWRLRAADASRSSPRRHNRLVQRPPASASRRARTAALHRSPDARRRSPFGPGASVAVRPMSEHLPAAAGISSTRDRRSSTERWHETVCWRAAHRTGSPTTGRGSQGLGRRRRRLRARAELDLSTLGRYAAGSRPIPLAYVRALTSPAT
jgi:hypothetical protein